MFHFWALVHPIAMSLHSSGFGAHGSGSIESLLCKEAQFDLILTKPFNDKALRPAPEPVSVRGCPNL